VKIAACREKADLTPTSEHRDGKTEKAMDEGAGPGLAPALLFIGCHSPTTDLLYASQLSTWEAQGAVKVLPAFSQTPELSSECKYAQDRVWRERKQVGCLFEQGARVYVCGSGRLGRGVKEVAGRIYRESVAGGIRGKGPVGLAGKNEGEGEEAKEVTEEEAGRWWEGLRGERFSVDVFD